MLQATRTVPVVFPVVGDPVGAGYVDSLARPGGNATGFMNIEFSMGGKWLELLKEIAPNVTRVGVLRDPTQGAGTSQFAVIQAVAPSLGPAAIPPPSLIPIDRLPAWPQETTGAAPSSESSPVAERQASPTNPCDVAACSRTYRSFDSATCTYQPYTGGPRRHCDR
jgi:hypothetical protein